MKFSEALIAWDDKSDKIKVGPWLASVSTKWSDDYDMTGGACETRLHRMTEAQRAAMLFITFNTIVVRDGVDVQAAHRAFLAIDEYRALISPGMEGADPPDGMFAPFE